MVGGGVNIGTRRMSSRGGDIRLMCDGRTVVNSKLFFLTYNYTSKRVMYARVRGEKVLVHTSARSHKSEFKCEREYMNE